MTAISTLSKPTLLATTDALLAANNGYAMVFALTGTPAVTIKLPPSPVDSDVIRLDMLVGSSTVYDAATLDGNGKGIVAYSGAPVSAFVLVPGNSYSYHLQYLAAAGVWVLF